LNFAGATISPVQALKNWQQKHPELFKKKVYNHTGLDTIKTPARLNNSKANA